MDSAPFEPVAVDLRDYVVFDTSEPAGRRVFATDVVAVDLLCLEPEQSVGARAFASADVVYTVLGGRAWIVTDDAEVTLESLQAVMIPAAVPHGVRNASPDPLILQMVASPPDEVPALPADRSAEACRRDASETEERGRRAARGSLIDRMRRALGSAPGRED